MTRKSVGIFNQLGDGTWSLQTDQGTFMGCSKAAAYSKWYRKNLRVSGPPGVGKSDMIKQAAAEEGIGFRDVRLARPRYAHYYSEYADGSVILHHPTFGLIHGKSRNAARANLRRIMKNGAVWSAYNKRLK